MANVFLSYSRKDKSAATRLYAALTARSRDVWIDWEDIPPTAAWWTEVTTAIEGADAVLFLISPDSATSKVCADELSVAQALNKRLLPMLVRDVDANTVPPAAAALNWIFVRDSDAFDTAIDSLLTALDTDLDWVRDHTRILVRAGDWQRHSEDPSYLLRGADLEQARRWRARADGKLPPPAPLHDRFLEASGRAEAAEIERLQGLYRSALARQLAAQAALMQRETDALLDRSILLATESMRRVPGVEADRVLRDGLRLRAVQVAAWRQQGLPGQLAASPCGRWIAGGGERERELVLRSTTDGRILRCEPIESGFDAAAFLPGADALVVLVGSRLLRLDVAGGPTRRIGDHPGHARSLCVLPGGDAVLSVGADGAVCHAADGSGVRWTLPLEAEAWVAAADASGQLVAVGGDDCVIRIADATTGRLLRELRHDAQRPVMLLERGASDAGIAGLSFGGEPLCLASAGLDGTVRVWDPVVGTELQRGSHGRDLLCVAMHGGRRLVASGGLDHQLRIWPADGGAQIASVLHQAAVTSVAWSDDGRWLVSACGDGCARLWQVGEDGRPSEVARAILPDWVGSVRFAGDHQVAAADDGTVVLFGVGLPADRGVDHAFAVKRAVCSDDGRQVLVHLDAHNLVCYDTQSWKWRILEQPDFGDSAWFTRDGAFITTCWDGGVREYDALTLVLCCLQRHAARVWKAARSHDDRRIATAVESDPCARVWDRGADRPALLLPHDVQVRAMDFSPDDGLLATGCDDGSVRVWSLVDGKLRWQHAHQGIVWSVAFDAQGRRVASVGGDNELVVRDAFSGEVLHRLPQPAQPDEVAFSPDGRWLAMRYSFRGPHLILVWELPAMRPHAEFGHDEQVATLAWNADGTLLASGCDGGMVRVFDVARGRELVRLPFARWCGSVRFVPQSRELLTASSDGKLRITCVDPLRMVKLAEARVPRGLSDAEWRQYLPDEPLPGARFPSDQAHLRVP
jgi:WD40 repeat protein